jgi:putative DNA methylase
VDKDLFILKPPQEVNLTALARSLEGGKPVRGREAREADVWDERKFPNFVGAAVWNAIALMAGGDSDHRGTDALKQWLNNSGYGGDRQFRGAFAVTLHLLRQAFGRRKAGEPWQQATEQAGVAWDLVLKNWRG